MSEDQDIVARLRSTPACVMSTEDEAVSSICDEAADYIVKLRQSNAAAVKYIDELRIERAELRRVTHGLPWTADGVPITPDLTLYRVEDDGGITIFSARMEDDNGDDCDDCWSKCYADEDAAQEAAAEREVRGE